MKALPLVSGIAAATALLLWSYWPGEKPAEPAAPAAPETAAAPAEAVVAETVDLTLAMEEKRIVAEFSGNGRDQLQVQLLNKATMPLRVTVPLGQVFESASTAPIVVIRAGECEVAPGKTREFRLSTAATRSSLKPVASRFELSFRTFPQLERLLVQAQHHPELTIASVQTAVLALTENLPLSAVAKFTLAASSLPSRFNTDPFRAETLEILLALDLLREAGAPEHRLALTIDPQLKIEAMIDPSARPVAMRYYGIAPEREWEFWRNELLKGEPSTRHYALYGIARFYPEVALQMLPNWARETRTNPVYRVAAVQALADTERGEALPILRGLSKEFGAGTELGRAATGAADYLGFQLARNLAARKAVAFRETGTRSGFRDPMADTVARN